MMPPAIKQNEPTQNKDFQFPADFTEQFELQFPDGVVNIFVGPPKANFDSGTVYVPYVPHVFKPANIIIYKDAGRGVQEKISMQDMVIMICHGEKKDWLVVPKNSDKSISMLDLSSAFEQKAKQPIDILAVCTHKDVDGKDTQANYAFHILSKKPLKGFEARIHTVYSNSGPKIYQDSNTKELTLEIS